MSPCGMPCVLACLFLLTTMSQTAGQMSDVDAVDDEIAQRQKRQLLYGGFTFNNTLNGGNVLLGGASFSMESMGSFEDALELSLLRSLLNTTTTTTTTTTAAPTTVRGRDLTLSCTCVGGRCVSYQDIYDLCLSTVKKADTCLANLDLLCENVKTQAAG